jgi:pimeloyl-ACP methyl ester carboxylesterase
MADDHIRRWRLRVAGGPAGEALSAERGETHPRRAAEAGLTTTGDLVGYPGAPEGDAEAFLKPDTVHHAFAQDLPEADRWLIVESQRPLTLSANTTPSGGAAWKTLPSWVVVGTEDHIIPPDTQRHMAERAGATTTEVDASHVSMVSHPRATLDAIHAAVAAVGD